MRELRTLLAGGSFFEGPRWHDGAWWVSDFYEHHVLRVTEDGTSSVQVEVPGRPSGLGWLPDGSLLVVSMDDRRVLRRTPEGRVTEHADLSSYCGGPANDMVVDEHGHAFVGDFGFDTARPETEAPTSLKRIAPDGTVTEAADGLRFPNGMAITPDGRTLLVGESRASRYTAFDLSPDGSLSNPRTWASLGEGDVAGQARVAPDGCALDAEGALWVADAVGRRFVRIVEGGQITDTITPPDGLGAFACALGGPGRRTLLLCCSPGWTGHGGDHDAVLLTTSVSVPGAGRP